MTRFTLLWLSSLSLCIFTFHIHASPLEAVQKAQKRILPELHQNGARLLPNYVNRKAWENLIKVREIDTEQLLEHARRILRQEMPPFPLEAFYDFSQNGNRYRFQRANGRRWDRLWTLCIAEAVEGKGQFLAAIAETIAGKHGISRDPTWVLSAHDRALKNIKGEQITIDLASSNYAWQLAEWLACFNSALPKNVVAAGVKAVYKFVLEPYLEMAYTGNYTNWWTKSDANWNPVCHAGVVGAALAIPMMPDADRALIVASAEICVRKFLTGFTPDGWTGEGVGYWGYGFGHFAQLCETVRRATRGKEDWLLWPEVRKPAMATPLSRLTGNLFPIVADCSMNVGADEVLTAWLGARLRFPVNTKISVKKRLDFPASFLFTPTAVQQSAQQIAPFILPKRTWFPDAQILIERTPRLTLMAMGNHNGVPHNHNDCGTFTLALDGVPVITDLGGEEYTARTFSSRRYESELLNSFGHPVPRPADTLQATGTKAAARVESVTFSEKEDQLVFDLSAAYPNATGLRRLQRTFTWKRRPTPVLELEDRVIFDTPQSFESALTTWGTCTQEKRNILAFTFEGKTIRVQVVTSAPWHLVKANITGTPMGKVWQARTPKRYAIRFDKPVTSGRILLKMTE